MTAVTAVRLPAGPILLPGDLSLPRGTRSLILFVHGSGSSRHSPRNRFVARLLHTAGFGTLLFDLLTTAEEVADARDGHLRFDIGFLAGRLAAATAWTRADPSTRGLQLGYFGAITGAAAALAAAADLGSAIGAVVSRGGRPDLAAAALERVVSPTRLIVGEQDAAVLEMNRAALARLRCPADLTIVRGASHLFEEPGTLAEAATLAARWFGQHLLTPASVP
jgi:dienelactone hydrolase